MIRAYQHQPSFKQGFARNAAESANPGLWKGFGGALVPALGVTGVTLHDVSGRGKHGTLTNMDPATDWVATENGYGLDFAPHNSTCRVIATDSICGDESFPCIVVAFRSHATNNNGERLSYQPSHHDIVIWGNDAPVFYAGFWLSGGFRNVISPVYPIVAGKNYVLVLQNNYLTRVTELFINGELLNSISNGPNAPMSSTDTHYLGNYATGTDRGFNGTISMFLARDGLLTPSEIQQHYTDPLAMFRPRRQVLAVSAAAAVPAAFFPYHVRPHKQIYNSLIGR